MVFEILMIGLTSIIHELIYVLVNVQWIVYLLIISVDFPELMSENDLMTTSTRETFIVRHSFALRYRFLDFFYR